MNRHLRRKYAGPRANLDHAAADVGRKAFAGWAEAYGFAGDDGNDAMNEAMAGNGWDAALLDLVARTAMAAGSAGVILPAYQRDYFHKSACSAAVNLAVVLATEHHARNVAAEAMEA